MNGTLPQMDRLTAYLSQLFEHHDLPCHVENEWVFPNSELPAIRASWYPDELSGRLDAQIVVRDGVVIEECFAGIGEGDIGLRDALTNFTANTFHVLLAALWNTNVPQEVEIEPWHANGKEYTAYHGNYGVRSSPGTMLQVPTDLFPRIQQAIEREPLTNDIHWFRLFFFNLTGNHTYEALKDNETWDAGIRCLESTSWPEPVEFYSVRLFMILRAVEV